MFSNNNSVPHILMRNNSFHSCLFDLQIPTYCMQSPWANRPRSNGNKGVLQTPKIYMSGTT